MVSFLRPPTLHLPRASEASHILVMGDIGTGKSQLIRQMACQIAARGEIAIFYDPHLEYLPLFYRPRRGDRILNPLDARCPYWTPGDEVLSEAEALTLAASLYTARANDHPFFADSTRRLMGHLLTFRPTAHQLVTWMSSESELDRLVLNTNYAASISRKAPNMRMGVIAEMNRVADTLKLVPTEEETSARWSATNWAKNPEGWLFLSSTPETRERLQPLTSLWLDTLVLRLMTPRPDRRKVWFIVDELASLQRLPQLHTAITENRKSDNPVVLGLQGWAQMKALYGQDHAEALYSQTATKFFFRTSESEAAKRISDTIGEIETERFTETRTVWGKRHRNLALERRVVPLVMPSEIQGLKNLQPITKWQNEVVRLRIPIYDLPTQCVGFSPRPLPPLPTAPSPPPTPEPVQIDPTRPVLVLTSGGNQKPAKSFHWK